MKPILTILPWLILPVLVHANHVLTAGSYRFSLDSHGALASIENKDAHQAWSCEQSQGQLICHASGTNDPRILTLENPASLVLTGDRRAEIRYDLPCHPPLTAEMRIEAVSYGSIACLRRDLVLRSKLANSPATNQLKVKLALKPATDDLQWSPRKNGLGIEEQGKRLVYPLAGYQPGSPSPELLAVPAVIYRNPGTGLKTAIMADPFFSAEFETNGLSWTYPAGIGLEQGLERRTIITLFGEVTPELVFQLYYEHFLREIQAGPAWLHDIALVDYDYMSDAGQGWFRDIDALSAAVPRMDRGKIFLCLHGWYDWVGRYSFNSQAKRFDPEWTAFGSYDLVRSNRSKMTVEGTTVDTGFAQCVPVRMTLAGLHHRLAYAHERGFRVGLYFADGMNSGDGLPDFSPDKVMRWGGWQGPDIQGKTYVMNPLHPSVPAFFQSYMQALLDEFGQELDGLVWDETFHVGAGALGNSRYPGYADRAMMRLTRELTLQVQDYNRQHHRSIAFLASDAIGPTTQETAPPYALFTHGTYQDSHCNPAAWSYGLFPNYRNVLWSCCWWPDSMWRWVEFGVRQYQAPVAISNGWGDNQGFAELSPEKRDRVLSLFRERSRRPTQLHWFTQLPTYSPSAPSHP